MLDYFLDNQNFTRLLAASLIFSAMALWEFVAPRRRQEVPRLLRWSNNLALVFVDVLVIRLVFPVLAVGFALTARQHGWGLFNILAVPSWLEFIVVLLILDMAIYYQHKLFHSVPLFWRFHRLHHADLELDVSTGLRFHPLEIVLSMLIKLALVALVGAPAVAVLVFEMLLNASSLFNHSNVRMPKILEKVLRTIIVTPDMHRVHHSICPSEANSNFGFNLSCWDRIFGTYKAEPRAGQVRMQLGVDHFRSRRDLWLDRLLLQPFRHRIVGTEKRAKSSEENDGGQHKGDNAD